jgi:enoyl-CoA hydratase
MEDAEVVLYEMRGSIAFVSFNRPKALNALNTEVNLALVEKLARAEQNDEVKVVILTGSGEKAFVAGADIKEMQNLGAVAAREFALNAKKSVDKIYHLKKPVIAAINGFCFGGGLEYALACDFRVASENAKFALPEITLGIISGAAGTQRLPRLIGMGKAKEMIYCGSVITAQEALNLGLVNYVFPRESLITETMAIAEKMTVRSAVALSLAKSAVNRGVETDIDTASMFEIDCFALCFTTEEQKRAMAAFAAKK